MTGFNRTFITCAATLGLAGAGCSSPGQTESPPGETVDINKSPTGSILTPSLCERGALDARVSSTGVDAFAFRWDGDHYQVVYSDLANKDVYSVQLGTDGQMKSAPVVVEATPGASSLPSLLPTASGYVVAWQDVEGVDQGSVHVHALDKSGLPISSGQVVATTQSRQMRPVLSDSPSGIAISWMEQAPKDTDNLTDVGESTTTIALLDDRLAVRTDIPPQRVNQGPRAGYPWLAGSNTSLGLLWSDDAGGRTDTYFSHIDAELKVPEALNVRDEPEASNAALLGRLALTDFGYVAAWEDHRSGQAEIYMSILDKDGNPSARGLVEEPETGNANWPHIAWTGTSAAIVYYQFRNAKPQVFLTFIDGEGKRIGGGADAQISNTTAWARYPDISWTGSEFGVMWIDSRDGTTELYFNHAACKKPAPI